MEVKEKLKFSWAHELIIRKDVASHYVFVFCHIHI